MNPCTAALQRWASSRIAPDAALCAEAEFAALGFGPFDAHLERGFGMHSRVLAARDRCAPDAAETRALALAGELADHEIAPLALALLRELDRRQGKPRGSALCDALGVRVTARAESAPPAHPNPWAGLRELRPTASDEMHAVTLGERFVVALDHDVEPVAPWRAYGAAHAVACVDQAFRDAANGVVQTVLILEALAVGRFNLSFACTTDEKPDERVRHLCVRVCKAGRPG